MLLLLDGRLWLEPCCFSELVDPMVLLLVLDVAPDGPNADFYKRNIENLNK